MPGCCTIHAPGEIMATCKTPFYPLANLPRSIAGNRVTWDFWWNRTRIQWQVLRF